MNQVIKQQANPSIDLMTQLNKYRYQVAMVV